MFSYLLFFLLSLVRFLKATSTNRNSKNENGDNFKQQLCLKERQTVIFENNKKRELQILQLSSNYIKVLLPSPSSMHLYSIT